ncbi:hypothetical protein [Stutzerimonas nitrititolerans]|jgi:hypothetical protein|uniref:hypothetical protein n=1 Tax=Stutzerimonas nitrititolerans TaxID=2482751 RepID=UPI0028A747CF|nr:hypothetical protein [Stutzerimonas nitrititolerans]
MFATYKHAELLREVAFGDSQVQHWKFVELEMHLPWFYVELVRDYGDEVMSSMLMIPTVPVLQQVIDELDDRSWLAQAFLVSPGYLRGEEHWRMEPLAEVSVAEDEDGNPSDYVYTVAGGSSYSTQFASDWGKPKTTQVIFLAGRHIRTSQT